MSKGKIQIMINHNDIDILIQKAVELFIARKADFSVHDVVSELRKHPGLKVPEGFGLGPVNANEVASMLVEIMPRHSEYTKDPNKQVTSYIYLPQSSLISWVRVALPQDNKTESAIVSLLDNAQCELEAIDGNTYLIWQDKIDTYRNLLAELRLLYHVANGLGFLRLRDRALSLEDNTFEAIIEAVEEEQNET
jgi:predicted nucleic-acid-binding protein